MSTKPILTQEAAEFERAQSDFTADPNSYGPIRTMMGLLEAQTPMIRQWAATWLWNTCRIAVEHDDKDTHDATSAQAGNLPR